MLTYAMEQRGDLSLYEYLYQCIRRDILSGDLATGTRLPSKRALAEHLRVSVITVEGAYQQLEAEGYVYTLPRRGFFVAPVEQVLSASLPVQPVMEPEERSWRLDLKRNRVDISRFPVATWVRLTRRVLSEDGEALLRPVPHQGLPCGRPLPMICESFEAWRWTGLRFWWAPGRSICICWWLSCWGRTECLPWKTLDTPKSGRFMAAWGFPAVRCLWTGREWTSPR